jgi:hypothetical protein
MKNYHLSIFSQVRTQTELIFFIFSLTLPLNYSGSRQNQQVYKTENRQGGELTKWRSAETTLRMSFS